jgi:hypothetical protein
MKKKILFVTAIFAGSLAFAQGTTTSIKNKKGLEYLPQAGDWAIQFDAAPALNYLGRAFSNAGATSPGAASPFGINSTFVGKKFNSASDAWRVKVGINISRMSEDSTFYNGNRSEYVKTSKSSTTNVVLGFGKEWRRGHNRLQGFYGVEGLLQIGSTTPAPSFEYSLNLKTAVDSSFEAANTPRTKGITKAFAFGIGARGFIGVEYFVLPKISIGGEFGWGFGYMTSSSEGESEIYNGTDVIPVKSIRPKKSGLVIDNDNGGTIFGGSASINVSFHF